MKKLTTRQQIHKSAWFLPLKNLLKTRDELQEAIHSYEKYAKAYFWKPHKNFYNQKVDIEQQIKVGFGLKISIEIHYWETEKKCIVTRNLLINKEKRTIKVLKTMLDELDSIIKERVNFKYKIDNMKKKVQNFFLLSK